MDVRCPSCFPANPDDIQFKQAEQAAIEQSKKNSEPVAIYKEGTEYRFCNAFSAYANGYPVCKVVSPYNGATPV
jgi:hypothetical protein